jgi:hypothetical protein
MNYLEYLKSAMNKWWEVNGPQPGDKERQREAMPSIFTIPILGKFFSWLDSLDPRKVR